MTGITDSKNVEIPTLAEFISAQSTDTYCRSAYASIEKPNSGFNVESDGVLFQVSSLDGASQRVVPASLSPHFFHFCHYSLLADHAGERQVYDCMVK